MYRRLLGIQNAGTAYDKVLLAPDFSSPLTSVSGSYESVRGKIKVAWKKAGKEITLTYQLPSNTQGELRLPNQTAVVLENGVKKVVTFSLD